MPFGTWDCQECGEPRINTKAGSVCNRGCGKIHPKMPAGAARRNHAIVGLGLQDARPERGFLRVPGDDRWFFKVKVVTKVLYEWPKMNCNQTLALDGERIILLQEATDGPSVHVGQPRKEPSNG